jgi:hypothetical protein
VTIYEHKRIPVEVLRQALAGLDGNHVEVNRVGNLLVTDDNDEYVGYIDFLEGVAVVDPPEAQ